MRGGNASGVCWGEGTKEGKLGGWVHVREQAAYNEMLMMVPFFLTKRSRDSGNEMFGNDMI